MFRTVSGAAPSGDERAWLRWPPRSLRPSRGFGATPLGARVSAEAGQGMRCGVRCSGPLRWLRGAAGWVGCPGAREVSRVRRKTRPENSPSADLGYCYGRRGFTRGERFC